MWHDSFICVPWLIHIFTMVNIWVSHGTHMNESWHTYEWVMALI